MRLISWWYFMIFGRCEISLWEISQPPKIMKFMPFGPCPKRVCFKIVGVFKQTCLVDGKARMRERVREKGGGLRGGMFWRGVVGCAGCLLCRPRYIDQGAFAFFFLALPVNELCLLVWPNLNTTSCFVLRIFRMRFPNKIFMLLGPLWDFLKRFHAFWALRFLLRFPNENS